MSLINHDSNGAEGLRIAASVCVVLGWIALVVGFIGGIIAKDVLFFVPWLSGFMALAAMYLVACFIRAIATMAEAADNINRQHEDRENEEESDL